VAPEQSLVGLFVEHGALGLLCLMEAFAIITLWRKLVSATEARIAEVQKMVQLAEQVRDTMDRLTEALTPRRGSGPYRSGGG
jgi:hypothetical protein